jgi:uncharacterized membrane protein YhaH (DUF805 family)
MRPILRDRGPFPAVRKAAMDYKWFLFSFKGRINRAKYWLATLIILCWMIFVLLILATLARVFGISGGPLAIDIIGISASIPLADDDAPSKVSLLPQLVTIPLTLLFGCCYAAVSIKRLHDRNRSGWWAVPMYGVPSLYLQYIRLSFNLDISIASPILLVVLLVPVSILGVLGLHRVVFSDGDRWAQPVWT